MTTVKLIIIFFCLSGIASEAHADVFFQPDRTSEISTLIPLANVGDSRAQIELGDIYINGQGVEANLNEGLKWYLLAANQGNVNAQVRLANIYFIFYDSHGLKQNDAEAMKWFRLAAQQGNAEAESRLAQMYVAGLGASVNLVVAYAILDVRRIRHEIKDEPPMAFEEELNRTIGPGDIREALTLSKEMRMPAAYLVSLDKYLKGR